jgi:predicted ATPase
MLALLTVLNDPARRGILCFEEPENGVHEGRINMLVDFLRYAATNPSNTYSSELFQILINTHSPAVMNALKDHEIVAADMVTLVDGDRRVHRTRMRSGVTPQKDLFDREKYLTRPEINALLKYASDAA